MTPLTFANAPTAYLRANGLLNKAPIYIISFGPIVGPLGTNYTPLPNQYCTAPVLNPTQSRKAIMSFPSGYDAEFNPITYQSTLGSLTFEIQDNNPQYPGEATKLITNYTLKNRLVTIRRGWMTISEVDYTDIYTGILNTVKLNSQGTGYVFEIIDPRKQMTNTILDGHTALTSPYTAGNSSIIVADASSFALATTPLTGSNCTPYIRMGSNLFSYTGLSTSTFIIDGTCTWSWVGTGGAASIQPAWIAGNVYSIGDIVYSNGGNYTSLTGGGGSSQAPFDAPRGDGIFVDDFGNSWQWNGLNGTDFLNWYPGIHVVIGNQCTNGGNRYICTNTGTTATSGGPIGQGPPVGGGTISGLTLVTPDGQGVSPAVNQSVGANVDNFVLFDGHPIDIILGILISTGTNLGSGGTNAPAGGPNYDVNPQALGVGIPYTSVNVSNFLVQKALMGTMRFHGYFQEAEQALKFIENYILIPANLGLYVNRQGQIDCKAIFQTLDMTGAITLDQTNIVGQPEFDGNLQTGGYFYNEPFINYDYFVVQGYYGSYYFNVDASWTNYMEVSQLPMDGRILNSQGSYGGAALAIQAVNTMNARFAKPPPVITIKTFDMISLLDPFSPVILNHPNVPNYQTGQRGGPINCQVVKVAPDWSTGSMTVTLLAVGWYG